MLFDPDKPVDVRTNYPGGVNTAHKIIYRNMRQNIRRMLPQAYCFPPNDYKAMVICGGPSLNDFTRQIKRRRKQGWKLITVNGTHDWCLDHGMVPSLHAIMDARPFNVRFVQRPQEACRYMLASQCDPGVFDALEGYDVHIWHAGTPSDTERKILKAYYRNRWGTVIGGTSIGTRVIGLAHLLGMRHVDVYGLDSCYRGDAHHAYDQPENDYKGKPWRVQIGRRKFWADPWMVKQADEVCEWAQLMPKDLKLTVHGDGMINYLITEAAAGRNPRRRVL